MTAIRKSEVENGHGPVVLSPVPPQKRMVLDRIEKSTPNKAKKGILYAPEGFGKTTWGSKCEKPIFISIEDGLDSVTVDKFPTPESWQDVFDAIDTLRVSPHDYKTLVIDTVDRLEQLAHTHILKRDKKTSVEDYGWGKGYVMVYEEFKRLMSPLDALRKEREIDIVLLGHSTVKTFQNPMGDNYDRAELKLDRRVATFIKEWSDFILYGNYDVAVEVKAGQSRGKGFGGDRVIYTSHSPAYDAKNRYGLAAQIGMEPSEFWSKVKGAKS